MTRIFVYIAHKDGVPDDTAAELLAAARTIDPTASPVAVLTGYGPDLEAACGAVRTLYSEVWKLSHSALAYPNAEVVRKALVQTLPAGSVVLIAHNHFGIDLSPGLSIKMNVPFISDALTIEPSNGAGLRVARQEFGGQINAHVRCEISAGAVINVRPGAFKPSDPATLNGQIVDKSSALGMLTAKRRYLETIVAEAGDVDITKQKVLISIGRGIQEQENITIAEELAEAMGGAVSCSRPVVDAKWMDKSRQVGSSGKTVKPKVYFACGISGSFQHLAGIKGNPLIIAINKNPKAPIFQVANVGIVADILEFLPELTNKVRELNPEHSHSSQGRSDGNDHKEDAETKRKVA
jgi:electron transfer flavoprotein alpha subunit